VPILYIVQELTVRFEIVSAKGHAELNKDHFGRGWACLSVTTIGIGDIPAIYARRPTGSLLEERYAFRCTINNGLKPEQFSTSAIRWAWGSAISPRGDMPKYRVPLLARRFGITVTVHSSHLRRTWAVRQVRFAWRLAPCNNALRLQPKFARRAGHLSTVQSSSQK
jgi:hypothetical protein